MGAQYYDDPDRISDRPPKKPSRAGSIPLAISLVMVILMLFLPWYLVSAEISLPGTDYSFDASMDFSPLWITSRQGELAVRELWSNALTENLKMVFQVTLVLTVLTMAFATGGLAASGKRPDVAMGFAICVVAMMFIAPIWLAVGIPWATAEDCMMPLDRMADDPENASMECEGWPFMKIREVPGMKAYYGPTWSWMLSWAAGSLAIVSIPLLDARRRQLKALEEWRRRKRLRPPPLPCGPPPVDPYGIGGPPVGPYGYPYDIPPRHPYRDPYGPRGPPPRDRYGVPYHDPYGPPPREPYGGPGPVPREPYGGPGPAPRGPYGGPPPPGGPSPQRPRPRGPPPQGP